MFYMFLVHCLQVYVSGTSYNIIRLYEFLLLKNLNLKIE